MKRLLPLLGYAWAAVALPLVLATFFGMNVWAGKLASGTKVTISPWYTGGEVVRTIDHVAYRSLVHRPVFDGLIGQKKTGFVQVDFVPAFPARLPAQIEEDIDFDADGSPDFHLDVSPEQAGAVVTGLTPRVLGLDEVFKLDSGLGVRVRVRNRP